ncbi:prepilin-type N-terminal cleavage/methylation domain-containing protein, partial [Clostridium sp.]|uniref:prepilin-type N-terminal cleavage/methylation domain-containing protein n=1 Tax=Clostridium sp. TaxID=1506 RepID=UPI003F32750B
MIKNKKKKAFTLIELIIVIAVIAILAAIAIPKFGEVRKNAALKSDIANAKTIANAATALIAEENLTIPAQGQETTIEVDSQKTTNNNIEEYLQNPPAPESKDPSGNKNFTSYTVKVNDKGDVTVYMGENQLFPNPVEVLQ